MSWIDKALAQEPRWAAENRAKTHCPKGHPYDAANTYAVYGRRRCKACARAYQAEYRATRRHEAVERTRLWRSNNPEKARAQNRRRAEKIREQRRMAKEGRS